MATLGASGDLFALFPREWKQMNSSWTLPAAQTLESIRMDEQAGHLTDRRQLLDVLIDLWPAIDARLRCFAAPVQPVILKSRESFRWRRRPSSNCNLAVVAATKGHKGRPMRASNNNIGAD